MPILKTIQAPNGTQVEFHKLITATVDYPTQTCTLKIGSWSSAEWHDNGGTVTWLWEVSASIALVTNYTPDQALLMIPEFQGGSVVPDNGSSLEGAKLRRWGLVKQWREAVINDNLITPYGEFQNTFIDRANITDAVLMAQVLTAAGQPVAIDWTLADNSVVTLDATAITTVGLLLGQKVQEAHAIARTLRAQIDAATTTQELDGVVWPL